MTRIKKTVMQHWEDNMKQDLVSGVPITSLPTNSPIQGQAYKSTEEIKEEIKSRDIANLKARLESYGYITEGMWHINDAAGRMKEAGIIIPDEEAREIVEGACTAGPVMERINERIESELRYRFPKYTKFVNDSLDEEGE